MPLNTNGQLTHNVSAHIYGYGLIDLDNPKSRIVFTIQFNALKEFLLKQIREELNLPENVEIKMTISSGYSLEFEFVGENSYLKTVYKKENDDN